MLDTEGDEAKSLEDLRLERSREVEDFLRNWRFHVFGKREQPPFFWLGADAERL